MKGRTNREKLIEILESTESAVYWNSDEHGFVEKIADHLIENGVTVQRWIPVDEKLPVESGMYLCLTRFKTHMVLPYSAKHKKFNAIDSFSGWHADRHSINVSHWPPLPEPPKGEQE